MRHLLVALLFLVAGPALAADGDFVRSYRSGEFMVVEYLLCDGSPGIRVCGPFDLHLGPTGSTSHPGMPLYLVGEIRADNCTTGATGQLQGLSDSGAAIAHNLHAGNLQKGGTTHAVNDPLSHRFIRYNISVAGSLGTCNDHEFMIRLFYAAGDTL